MDGHTNSVISLLVVNRLMYTGSADGSAKCWVTEFGDCTRQYKGHRGSVINMKFQTGICQYFACLKFKSFYFLWCLLSKSINLNLVYIY